MESLEQPKAVLFDWDGTLVDSVGALTHGHNLTHDAMGLPRITEAGFLPHMGKPRDDVYAALYGDRTDEAKTHFAGFYAATHTQNLREITGAGALLQALHMQGIVLGVVTNKQRKFVGPEIAHMGWDRYFSVFISADDVQHAKPAPDAIYLALEKIGMEAGANTYFVGDSDNDLAAAQAAGCPCIFIDNADTPMDVIESYNPIHITKNCSDILLLFQEKFSP